MNYIYIAIGLLFIWVLGLSFFLYKTRSHYQHLVSWSRKESLEQILETIINKHDSLSQNYDNLKSQLEQLNLENKSNFNKIGMVRFNPFERIGGDQSYVIALLDRLNNGIAITFLYTRDGVRVYTKKLTKGQCHEMELSSEEIEAIKKAS